eukprot:UN09196
MAKFKTFNKKSDFINKQKQKMNKCNDILSIEEPQKRKRRRRRRKNKDIQNQTNLNNVSPQQQTAPIKSKCNACHQMFGTKNKLYDHLKNYPKHALKSQH